MDPKNKLDANGEIPLEGEGKQKTQPADVGTAEVKKDIAHVLASKEKPLTLDELVEGNPVQVFDYDNVSQKFDSIARMLRIEEQVAADQTVQHFVRETGNKIHFMAGIRRQEIALDRILPLIAQIPPISQDDLWKSGGQPGKTEKMMYIAYVSLLLATGHGSKMWPIDCFAFLAMDGARKAQTLKDLFAKSKLKSVTTYERQTGKNTFATYEANSGEMNEAQFEAAKTYSPSADELQKAQSVVMRQMGVFGADREKVDPKVVEAAAKIHGGSRHPNVNQDNWLFAEAMIFAGRP